MNADVLVTYVFYKFLDVYLIPDPSQEVSMQMTYCIWPHYSNKLKAKTTQTNIVNFSLLNCGELWGRGEEEEGSHLPIHCIVCLDTAGPDLLRLFCCCCCSIPRMMRMSEWLFLGFRVWALASRVDRIWFAVLCIRSARLIRSSPASAPGVYRARRQTRSIATIVATLWRCNEKDHPGPLIIWLCHVPGRARLLLPYYKNYRNI